MPASESNLYVESLLLQSLQQNDERALKYLFSTYYNKLYRTGIKWSADSHLTEECIQGVFQDVWQYRHSLGPIHSFEAYLTGSLRKRLAKQVAKKPQSAHESVADLPLPTASYEEILILQEENDQRRYELQRALDTLTPRQKEIIVLKYFEELSYREIAERTGLEVNTLYKILHEGLKRLKASLVTA